MLVVLGVDAQKLNKYRKSPSVCVCFSEDPPGTFPLGVLFFILKRSLPTFELLTPGVTVIVFRKKYKPPAGGSQEEITVIHVFKVFLPSWWEFSFSNGVHIYRS